MNGNEKIIERILAQAQESAAAIEAEAEKKAAARLEQEQATLAVKARAAAEEAAKVREHQLRTARSAAELAARNAELSCRREEIDRTVQATLAYLRALPAEEYFALLARLCRDRAEAGGVLLLSKADLARVPAGFAESLGMTMGDVPTDIDGGCVLKYGDIEDNLSFEALLDERRAELESCICRELWEA